MGSLRTSAEPAPGLIGIYTPVLAITEQGLVLGGTVLAPLRHLDGAPEIAIDGAEERILALLATVYGTKVGARALDHIRRASRYWRNGEQTLAAIELALTGLPPLRDEKAASLRLSIGERLLAEGVSPCDVVKACGLDPAKSGLAKAGFTPDQPRIPAGNPDGGQWTSSDTAGGGGGSGSCAQPPVEPISAAGPVLIEYKVIKEPPKDAKVVIPPDGVPIRAGDPPVLLIAPPRADFQQVYAAGWAIASLPYAEQIRRGYAALHHGGTFDFQRNFETLEDFKAYEHASNYAVGVYMAGAGYSLWQTLHIAETYALFNSSNYNSQEQTDWTNAGWHDATAGRGNKRVVPSAVYHINVASHHYRKMARICVVHVGKPLYYLFINHGFPAV